MGRRTNRVRVLWRAAMSEIAGSHVLITGGASGIGRLMALECAARGARVSVWDIHAENLEKVIAELAARGREKPRGFLCDVSRRERVYEVAVETRTAAGPVDVLINNAGLVSGKAILDIPDEKIEATFAVNTLSLFWLAKAFLPGMIERNRGHVVTIASASGLIGVAKLSDYAASKWAAVGFDESLRAELRQSAPGREDHGRLSLLHQYGDVPRREVTVPSAPADPRGRRRGAPRRATPFPATAGASTCRRSSTCCRRCGSFRLRSSTGSRDSSASTHRWTNSRAAAEPSCDRRCRRGSGRNGVEALLEALEGQLALFLADGERRREAHDRVAVQRPIEDEIRAWARRQKAWVRSGSASSRPISKPGRARLAQHRADPGAQPCAPGAAKRGGARGELLARRDTRARPGPPRRTADGRRRW